MGLKTKKRIEVALTALDLLGQFYPKMPRPADSTTSAEYAAREGISYMTAQSRLQRLVQRGLMTRGFIPGTKTKWYAPVVGAKK